MSALDELIAEWNARAAEIARLRAAIKWTREVRPGKNPESGGAIVHMTWDEFNTMRSLADEALALPYVDGPTYPRQRRRVRP